LDSNIVEVKITWHRVRVSAANSEIPRSSA